MYPPPEISNPPSIAHHARMVCVLHYIVSQAVTLAVSKSHTAFGLAALGLP